MRKNKRLFALPVVFVAGLLLGMPLVATAHDGSWLRAIPAGQTRIYHCNGPSQAVTVEGLNTLINCKPGATSSQPATTQPPSTTAAPATTQPPSSTTQPPTPPAPDTGQLFSAESAWNTGVPADANFVDEPGISGGYLWMNRDQYSTPVIHTDPSYPVTQVHVDASWGWPEDTISLHLPPGQLGSPGTDAALNVIDGNTSYDFWIFTRDDDSHAHASAYGEANIVTGTGWGTANPFKGAGIHASGSSTLAGLIVGNELTQGIHHALAVGTNFTPQNCPAGFEAPAIAGDGSCAGRRFAIPGNVAKPAGLTPQGSVLFDALKKYGAYSVDSCGCAASIIFVADPNSVPNEDVQAVFNDFAALQPLLKSIQ